MTRSHRFDNAAATYERFADIQREMAVWLAEWIPQERRGDALEIAAGTGLFTDHLVPWEGPLIASDLSPNMVAAGKRRRPEVAWVIRDADTLGETQLDWIFSCSFLQWSDDPEALLRAWGKSLKPGGRLLAGFFVNGAIPELHRLLGAHAPIQYRESEDWQRIFGRAGFFVDGCDVRVEPRDYPNAIDLFRRLHKIGATRGPRLKTAAMRTLLRAYEAACPHPDGVIARWHFCRILAATKAR